MENGYLRHSKTCNIEHPCKYCLQAPKHQFVGNMDDDCQACGYSIYMPCHQMQPLEVKGGR